MNGTEVKSTVGPFNEDFTVRLSCVVNGGRFSFHLVFWARFDRKGGGANGRILNQKELSDLSKISMNILKLN